MHELVEMTPEDHAQSPIRTIAGRREEAEQCQGTGEPDPTMDLEELRVATLWLKDASLHDPPKTCALACYLVRADAQEQGRSGRLVEAVQLRALEHQAHTVGEGDMTRSGRSQSSLVAVRRASADGSW